MYRVKSLVVLDPKAETETGPVTDDDYRRVALYLHSVYGWSAKLDDVRDAVKTVARDEKIDPVRDALEKLALAWDGVKRLDDWLVRYLKIDDTDCADYVRKVARVSLIQAVGRVMHPGAKADVMPVIIGPGGEGKGKALQALASGVGPGLYTNTGFDMSKTSDIIEKCAGRLIVEAAEMDAIKRGRDVSAFKSAMTVLEDTHRKPWESESEDFPRRNTFWGTSNEDEFITDSSDGQGRRFWPLASLATRDDPMDVQGLEAIAPQLWGEAVAAFMAGELSYIDHRADRAAAEQWDRVIERCRVSDPLDDAVDAYLMAWAAKDDGWRASAEIAKEVGLVREFSTTVEKKDFYRLADLLKARKLKKAKQGTFRGWVFTAVGLNEYRGRARGAGLLPRIESKGLKVVKRVA